MKTFLLCFKYIYISNNLNIHVGGWLYKIQLAFTRFLQPNGQSLCPNPCLPVVTSAEMLQSYFITARKMFIQKLCLHILPTSPQCYPVYIRTLHTFSLYLPAHQSFPWPITNWEVPVLQPKDQRHEITEWGKRGKSKRKMNSVKMALSAIHLCLATFY